VYGAEHPFVQPEPNLEPSSGQALSSSSAPRTQAVTGTPIGDPTQSRHGYQIYSSQCYSL